MSWFLAPVAFGGWLLVLVCWLKIRELRGALRDKDQVDWKQGQQELSDRKLLDWAESHPEEARRSIDSFWANCGRGFREEYFNFRGAIRDAQRKVAGENPYLPEDYRKRVEGKKGD